MNENQINNLLNHHHNHYPSLDLNEKMLLSLLTGIRIDSNNLNLQLSFQIVNILLPDC